MQKDCLLTHWCPFAEEIDLSFNKISGGISRDIGRLQALRKYCMLALAGSFVTHSHGVSSGSFKLHNNKLTGRYPLEFDQILNLGESDTPFVSVVQSAF